MPNFLQKAPPPAPSPGQVPDPYRRINPSGGPVTGIWTPPRRPETEPEPFSLPEVTGPAPIGQGFLTPFEQELPQLFRDVPNFIGGFGGTGGSSSINNILSQLQGMGSISNMPLGGDPVKWIKDQIRLGKIDPSGLYLLLGMLRGEVRSRTPTAPTGPAPRGPIESVTGPSIPRFGI